MSKSHNVIHCCLMLVCCSFLLAAPAHAFTATSLDITVDRNGDAIATFRFTLEGVLENSIPQSILEEELKKGLTTSAEPPELKSMDKSGAVLLMKKFADTSDVATGTEYRTASMDFKKAEVALQNSALSGVISADFSPERIVLTFPDSYKREFSNVDVLPAVFHTVIDPSKTVPIPASPNITPILAITATPAANGFMNVTSSPLNMKVYLDFVYIGEAPAIFPEIAPGTHRVDFRKDGYESVSKNVTVIAGKTTNVMVVLRYIPSAATGDTTPFSAFLWPVAILALIAVAGGGYYFWSRKKKSNETVEEDTGRESE